MAIGKQRQFDGKALSLRLRLKDGSTFLDCATFDVQEKQGDKYVTTRQTVDVSGDLFRVDTRESAFEGNPIRNVKLGLRDSKENEAYFVEFTLGSNIGRNLANSILNLRSNDGVEIGLYGQKSKTNGKTYPAVALRQAGSDETIKWAYEPGQNGFPAVREFEGKGGKKERDYTAQEVFLFERLKELGAKLSKNAPAASTPAPTAANTPVPQKAPVATQEDLDSVPF